VWNLISLHQKRYSDLPQLDYLNSNHPIIKNWIVAFCFVLYFGWKFANFSTYFEQQTAIWPLVGAKRFSTAHAAAYGLHSSQFSFFSFII